MNAGKYESAVGKATLANSLQLGFSRFAATLLFVPGLWYGEHLVKHGASTAGT